MRNRTFYKIVSKYMSPLVLGVIAVFGAYRGYVSNEINRNSLIHFNTVMIQKNLVEIDKIKKSNKDILIKMSYLKNFSTKRSDEISELSNNLNRTANYQETLRKEVQEVAEGKLNITEFWNYMRTRKRS